MNLWVYLHFPLLPLEMLYTVPSPGPCALLDTRSARLGLCNAAAAEQGLQSGMALATALSLCPGLTPLTRQPHREAEQLLALALAGGGFSAQIALDPPDGLLLEAASMLAYFEGLAPLVAALAQHLEGIGFSARLATGHTPLCARVLARQGGFIAEDGEPLAEAHLRRLAPLPVACLELDTATAGRLRGLGLARLEQLLALPRAALADRLGTDLLDRLDRLTGFRSDPPRYFEPPSRFGRTLELGHELESAQALLFPLRRMLGELEGFLHYRQQQALALILELRGRQGEGPRIELGHGEGEHRAEAWLALWRLRLERVRLETPVIALRLTAERFRRRGAAPADLFDPRPTTESPGQLLARLQTRLGVDAVCRLAAVADHRPEHSWQPLPADQAPAAAPPLPDRPGWLLHAPQPLAAEPARLSIVLLKGPERIAGGWWDERPVRRDYYIARWPDGRLGWLFRDDRGCWFLHGWFG